MATKTSLRALLTAHPWTKPPLLISAPMKNISGPSLAVATSSAGGIGFIGPGNHPAEIASHLLSSANLIRQSPHLSKFTKTPTTSASTTSQTKPQSTLLPIGIGIQTWTSDLPITIKNLTPFAPAIIWLFAPRHGQKELDEWTREIRNSSPETKIWIQVASVGDAALTASSPHRPDVLVIQGTDAGGHSRVKGAGIMTLLPEVIDSLKEKISGEGKFPLIAAGGIIDARGFAAALTLGAAGVAMGTRFLASREAVINPGYQNHILTARDGGQTTVRTQLYNHLRGTMGWPAEFDARGLVNQSWRDFEAGVPFEENKRLYEESMGKGEEGWGEDGRMATYAGTGIGLVREVRGAREIVEEVRGAVEGVLRGAVDCLNV